MSGSQLKDRVLIPLAVIVGTVLFLGILGKQLLGLSGASDQASEPTPSASPTATDMPTSTAMPSGSAEPSSSATTTGERFPVIVMNATDKVGYAKKVGDNLNFEDWVIQSVGNWTGVKPTTNTVYYPAGAEAAAAELAKSKYVNGVVAPATVAYDQTALTLVLAK